MKSFILLLFLFTGFYFFAQDYSLGRILSKTARDSIFTDEVKKHHTITFPIFRVYGFTDNSGQRYLLLTEKQDSIIENDTLHSTIQAFQLQQMKNGFLKEWEMNDLIKPEKGETNISFWTKYMTISDIDSDGFTDPIIIFGTQGMNGTDDGRIKILIYYKGSKIAIRHQNGVLDGERNTQVDEEFYKLPLKIQAHVKSTMEKMQENNHAIFPYGWQEAMKKKKLKFDEN